MSDDNHELTAAYGVVLEILDYFESYNLVTHAPVAAIILRERAQGATDTRASILAYLSSEATKRKASRIESRVLRAMVSNIKAEMDRG